MGNDKLMGAGKQAHLDMGHTPFTRAFHARHVRQSGSSYDRGLLQAPAFVQFPHLNWGCHVARVAQVSKADGPRSDWERHGSTPLP